MDQRPTRPKLFGIGLNKTGTTTLGVCMINLGYRHTTFAPPLLEALHEGRIEPTLEHSTRFDSFDDWPWPLVYRELDERFPGSKFVLTVRRDPVTWLDSLRAHTARTPTDRYRRLAYGFPTLDGYEAEHLAFYERHRDEVHDHFRGRPGQLVELCWERGDGWAELCGFLGVPELSWPFPHANPRPERATG